MKTALCLSGQLRQFKAAFPSIKEHLIDALNADVFLSTWNYQLSDERNYEDGLIGEFIELYKPIRAEAESFGATEHERFRSSPHCLDAFDGVRVDRILAMWHKANRAFALAGAGYGLYIRCRCDLKFLSSIPNSEVVSALENNCIGIPFSRDYESVRNDQFAFGSFASMEKYLSVESSIAPLVGSGFKVHPERLLFEHLKRSGLETVASKIRYRVIRKHGEENPCLD